MSATLDLNSPCQRANTCHFLRKCCLPWWSLGTGGKKQCGSLLGYLLLAGYKCGRGGLLMPCNNRNQLLRWESGHLLCQLQPGTVEGRGRAEGANVGQGASALLSSIQPRCGLVLLTCSATFQWQKKGIKARKGKAVNVIAFFCLYPMKTGLIPLLFIPDLKCPREELGSWCQICIVLYIHFVFICYHSVPFFLFLGMGVIFLLLISLAQTCFLLYHFWGKNWP